MQKQLCPCGSQLPYATCCEVLHLKPEQAATAEALMRSRFSAFYLNKAAYLVETLHPSKRADDEYEQVRRSIANTQWLSLRILKASSKSVEFVAFYRARAEHSSPINFAQLHEQSNFVFEHQRWFYLDGKQLPAIKIGRNDDCPCASGLKYKRCQHSQLLERPNSS
ncbi:YchJ family protein [Agaribacterium haliotis]|uniref:YchJ family protein n=1 Tax=Agaribacterium haliotis TaxID=2013869 RepID=UPI000BB58403|nr:YchJ family metal-binding protein [Agaribacterium haliotis]